MISNEIWKDIKGYEGFYQISNYGRVKSLPRKVIHKDGVVALYKGVIMKTHTPLNRYEQIRLSKNGKSNMKTVHRLVAEAFLPNPNNYPEVNHIDEVKDNNVLENLEWCNYEYNINYGGGITRRSVQRKIKISQYDLDDRFIRHYESGTDAEQYGYCRKAISACCRGVAKTHSGYKWRYASEND